MNKNFRCGLKSATTNLKLNAKELRGYKARGPKEAEETKGATNPLYIILDNVLDTYNVGSIFRLADAVAAEKVFLCGETPIPPNSRIKKASINTTEVVDWEYAPSAIEALAKLKVKSKKLKVVAVEQDKRSIPYTEAKAEFPVAVVVGNESYGVSKEVLEMCDEIVELPMFGVNISLNVMVSLGIVLYKLMEKRAGGDIQFSSEQ